MRNKLLLRIRWDKTEEKDAFGGHRVDDVVAARSQWRARFEPERRWPHGGHPLERFLGFGPHF